MIIYNVTVSVDHEVQEDWLNWMKTVHIPDVMATGFFTENRILRVISAEDTGVTFAIQYTCRSMKDLEAYQREQAPRLQKEHTDRYREKAVAFRTLLELVP